MTSRVSSGKISLMGTSSFAAVSIFILLSGRTAAEECIVQKRPDRIPLDGPWIPIGRGDRRRSGFVQVGLPHADLAKGGRSPVPRSKVKQGPGGMIRTERAGRAIDGGRSEER